MACAVWGNASATVVWVCARAFLLVPSKEDTRRAVPRGFWSCSPSSPIQVTALTENRYAVRHVRGAGHVQLLCQCLASALVLQTVDLIFRILVVKGGGGAPSVGVLAQCHGPSRVFDSIAVEAANANGVACRERAPSRRQLWEGGPWQWRQGLALYSLWRRL